jgi:hypothetical protein
MRWNNVSEKESASWKYSNFWALPIVAQSVTKKVGSPCRERHRRNDRKRYRMILATAQKECPAPTTKRKKGQRGRIKKPKSRNLLERLIEREEEVL